LNFFGHAAIAHRVRPTPEFVFGAMLPDLAGMCGARGLSAVAGDVRDGVAHHHVIDGRFHGATAFVDLCAEAVTSLQALGVRRGPSRAAAHVGVELLLDGVLARDATSRRAYLESLEHARLRGVATTIASSDPAAVARIATLVDRLLSYRHLVGRESPEGAAERLRYALANRPRLALTEEESRVLVPWAERLAPRVEARADELVAVVMTESRGQGTPD
jgi:hypothetical protein